MGGGIFRRIRMKVGERFFQDNFGYKAEYEVDVVNADGTFNSHLVKVHGISAEPKQESFLDIVEPASDTADTPVEEVKDDMPKATTAKATSAPKRAYNRKPATPTTTKK